MWLWEFLNINCSFADVTSHQKVFWSVFNVLVVLNEDPGNLLGIFLIWITVLSGSWKICICQSPAPAARGSTWREEPCQWVTRQPRSFLGLPIYFNFKIFLYTFTKALGQRGSLVAQTVKRLPAMWETRVRFLGWEDPLEKEMAIHSSTLSWKIPWTE